MLSPPDCERITGLRYLRLKTRLLPPARFSHTSEREELCLVLAASLGKPDAAIDEAWFDEAEDHLAACDGVKRR